LHAVNHGGNVVVGGGGATRPLQRDWGVEELQRRPNSRATPQGLNQRSKLEEVVPKKVRRRGSDAGQFRRRRVRSCRGCPQALQEEFSFCFILHR